MTVKLIAAMLVTVIPSIYGTVSQPTPLEITMKNSPGVSCRTIALAMVYENASLSSKVLGRTQNFVAITGRQVNSFFPIVTGSGVKGWVLENQLYPENGPQGSCRVQVLPDGRLLFGWS